MTHSTSTRRDTRRPWGTTLAVAGGGLLLAVAAHADFVNGGFEATPDFSGWTQKGYTIPGAIPSFPPTTESDLGLTPNAANIRSAVLSAGSESLTGGALAWSDKVARVHTAVNANGKNNRASAIEQSIVVANGDIDADGKVHIRFTAAPVLEDPGHQSDEQPYFFIEITKADGTSLFHTFNFANQAGVPWVAVGGIKYTDWQAFDIPLDPGLVALGDTVTVKVIAAGCGPSGHAGAVYLNNVRSGNGNVQGASLWVTAEGPAAVNRHTNPDGTTDVTYTYTYKNNGNAAVSNVTVNPAMPQTTDSTPKDTSFVGITQPSFGGGACTAPAGGVGSTSPAACSIGTLQPGESGTFTMTVRVPADTAADLLNNGTYPIAGTGVPSLLGPLVKTNLLADMVPDVSQLPPGGGVVGTPYPAGAAFSCTNQGSTAAQNASCAATGLPAGVTVGQCTISPPTPALNWSQGSAVPAAATVTCPVTGTPTTTPANPPKVTTGGDNDGDPGNNQQELAPVPDVLVDLANLPTTATVGQPYSGSFSCTNIGTAAAVAGTSCAVANLPAGLAQGACTISPGNAAWVPGNAIALNETVTCAVTGTPANHKGPVIVNGSAGATGDSNMGNNTAQKQIDVTGAPNVVIDLGGLPPTGTVNQPYSGSFTCQNIGSADAASAACTAMGLPPGVALGACTISPASAGWTSPGAIPEGQTVTCQVSGTPGQTGTSTATGTGGSSTATKDVTIGVAAAPTPVPTLTQWGQLLMAGLLAALGLLAMRRTGRNAG
ncbi:IPTL-CTERM sorting domain-containing protein [Comamonas humi]